jgi:predicted enzyme related to lactoylglutathione lyase
VDSIEASTKFYSEMFCLTTEDNFGTFVSFRCGLSLWERKSVVSVTGVTPDSHFISGRGGMELEFRAIDIEKEYVRFRDAGVRFVQHLIKLPWEQRMFGCVDPDGHVIIIAEDMTVVAKRLLMAGYSIEEIIETTQRTRQGVEQLLK